MNALWLVVKEPGERARTIQATIDRAIEDFIGDDVLVDTFRFDSSGFFGYCDDDGLGKNLPHNFHRGVDPIVGAVVFSRCNAAGEDIGFDDQAQAEAFAVDLNARVMR